MPTNSSTRPDPDLVRASAIEVLAAFRSNPPAPREKLISDAEMEGQMRGLPEVRFQLNHTRAATSEVGKCVAVGYMGGHALRIYRKTAAGWCWHNFTLKVEVPTAQKVQQVRGRRKVMTVPNGDPPTLSWEPTKPKAEQPARTARRRDYARR